MNSRAKYEEIKHTFTSQTNSQREVKILTDILSRINSLQVLETFVEKCRQLSNENPNMSTIVVYQIATDEALVDELCN